MVWSFQVNQNLPHGAIDLLNERISQEFKVNGQRVKHYMNSVMDHTKEISLLQDPTL